MRNGNVETLSQTVQQVQSSYRTYEEWKLIQFTMNADQKAGSYRTYEEWKRAWGEPFFLL